MVILTLRKKRKDSKLGNIKSLPAKVRRKYRGNAQLKSVLKKEKVTSLYQLGKKYKKKRRKKAKRRKRWFKFF